MASAVIGEGVMIIASVIVAGALAGVILNQVGVFESTIVETTDAQQEKMLTKVKIVYASNSTDTVLDVWVKNTGKNPVTRVSNMDVFFGEIDQVTSYLEFFPDRRRFMEILREEGFEGIFSRRFFLGITELLLLRRLPLPPPAEV